MWVFGLNARATHLAWYFAHDVWPAKGLVVRHRCDNPNCVRPDHLELGTQKENLGDAAARGRNTRGEASHWAKLTAELVASIKDAVGSNREVAIRFSVSSSTVSRIRNKQTWRHLF